MNMTNDNKWRFATDADVLPKFDGKGSYEEYQNEVGRKDFMTYGTIGYNMTIHALHSISYVINGEEVLFSTFSKCGTATTHRVTQIDRNAKIEHVNCEKCLKKLAKMGA